MIDIELDFDEAIILQAESVGRYIGEEEHQLDEMYLTNKNLILVSDETDIDTISLGDIKLINNSVLVKKPPSAPQAQGGGTEAHPHRQGAADGRQPHDGSRSPPLFAEAQHGQRHEAGGDGPIHHRFLYPLKGEQAPPLNPLPPVTSVTGVCAPRAHGSWYFRHAHVAAKIIRIDSPTANIP